MKNKIFSKNLILFIVVVLILSSCSNDIDNIIEHKDEIISITKNQEISVDKYYKTYYLVTNINNKTSENFYYFKKNCIKNSLFSKKCKFIISHTEIQSNPDTVVKLDVVDSVENICLYYQKLSEILLEYNIIYISHSRNNKNYCTMFLKNGNILTYYPNMPKEDEKFFLDFKKKSKDWYLYDGNVSR
ncbi:MAG: hypothetical protein H6Q25_457 [Bacteroidetes bacterium]|nr:hypothetical protein [Bacteroidota bacterium]